MFFSNHGRILVCPASHVTQGQGKTEDWENEEELNEKEEEAVRVNTEMGMDEVF